MKRLILILMITFLSGSLALKAQFDTQLSNYWATTNYFNPGYAGQSGKLDVSALYRLQWIGIEGAPKSAVIVGDMPLKIKEKQHGVGITMYNDQIGLFKSNVISGQFSYKVKLFEGSLGIGLQLGYVNQSFDSGKIELPKDDENYDESDEAIPADASGSSFDASLGLFYSKTKWYVGLSATHILAPKIDLGENVVFEIPRSYYFTAGYNIQLNNPLLELRPSVLIKTTELSSFYMEGDTLLVETKSNTLKGMLKQTQIDVSLRMVYNKFLWGGVSWRKEDAIVVMLGGRIKMFEIGYAYDFPISKIRTASTGSHELFLKYTMDMNLKKGKKGKYKSVRIL